MNNDREKDYNESNQKKQKIIVISLIAVVAVLIITVVVIAILFINKQNKQGSGPIETEPAEKTEHSSTSVSSTISSTEIIKTTAAASSSTENQITTTTENSALNKEHGFVINSMGYTYLYYGKGFEQFNGTTATAKRYASALNSIKSKLPGNIKFYSIVAPTSVAFADIPREIRVEDDFSNSDQKNNIDIINSNLEGINGLNVFVALKEHETEKIFFNTDKNWTALASYYAYTEFCKSAEIEPVSLETLEKTQIEGYLGSFYNATKSNYLLENSDIVECWLVDKAFPANITMYNNGLSYSNRQLVTTQISSPVSYGFYAFLGGPGERFEIKTENTSNKKILVIGDASAFPFVPFLAANYAEIYFINAESYTVNDNNSDIQSYIEGKGINDVLFLSYATNTQRSGYCAKISNLCS